MFGISSYLFHYLCAEPSADELRRLMMLHGGQFHVYYSRTNTTHIIANNLPNSKIQELKGQKVIRPEWITDRCVQLDFSLMWYCKISALNFCFVALASVKAGHLLPYLQYQLYAKHKGPLFPGVTLRKTSDVSGTSQGLLQPSIHQKPHLQQHSNQEQFQSTCQNKSTPQPSLSRPCQGSIHSQFIQQSSAAHCTSPQTCHTASTHTSTDPKHRTPSDHPHKPSQSSLQTPHPNLGQRACQLQPQINSSCSDVQSSCKTVESRR